MKDIIDRYEESKYPGLLELFFFMVLIIDLLLAIWLTFMAPLHIGKMPYLKLFYGIIIPISYIAPVTIAICTKKLKKNLLVLSNSYLGLRVVYLSFIFICEIEYRIAEASSGIDKEMYSSIISSGILSISFTLVFSITWVILLNASKKIKYHISN